MAKGISSKVRPVTAGYADPVARLLKYATNESDAASAYRKANGTRSGERTAKPVETTQEREGLSMSAYARRFGRTVDQITSPSLTNLRARPGASAGVRRLCSLIE